MTYKSTEYLPYKMNNFQNLKLKKYIIEIFLMNKNKSETFPQPGTMLSSLM